MAQSRVTTPDVLNLIPGTHMGIRKELTLTNYPLTLCHKYPHQIKVFCNNF